MHICLWHCESKCRFFILRCKSISIYGYTVKLIAIIRNKLNSYLLPRFYYQISTILITRITSIHIPVCEIRLVTYLNDFRRTMLQICILTISLCIIYPRYCVAYLIYLDKGLACIDFYCIILSYLHRCLEHIATCFICQICHDACNS